MADDSGFECRRCEWLKGRYKEESGCFSEVKKVVLKVGSIELHRCPRAILRDGYHLRMELEEIFSTYDFRKTGDYATRPALLVQGWNEISATKAIVTKARADEVKAKAEAQAKTKGGGNKCLSISPAM